jgi:hypothetical protein
LTPRAKPTLVAGPARAIAIAVLAAFAVACSAGAVHDDASSPLAGTSTGSGSTVGRSRSGQALGVAVAPFSLPTAVQREVAVADGVRILLAGGLDAAGSSTNAVFAFVPRTGRVTTLGTLPHPVHDAAGAMIGRKLFVFGGGASGESTDAVQAFDPSSGRGSVVAHLPVPLSDISSATLGGVVYLVGGYDGSTARTEIYATIDGIGFELAGRLPQGLRYTAVAAAGSGLVIAGGETASGPARTVLLFEPRKASTAALPPLFSPIGHAVAFRLGGVVYVAGGLDREGRAVRSVTRIDTTAMTVSRSPRLPKAVSDAPAAVISGAAWILGGWDGQAVRRIMQGRLP